MFYKSSIATRPNLAAQLSTHKLIPQPLCADDAQNFGSSRQTLASRADDGFMTSARRAQKLAIGAPTPQPRAEALGRRRGPEPVRRRPPPPPARNLVKPATLADRKRRVRLRRQRGGRFDTDAGEETLRAGDAAAFKAGIPNGHHLQNRSMSEALVLEVGTRLPGDGCYYSDIDMMLIDDGPDGHTRRDGSPYAPSLLQWRSRMTDGDCAGIGMSAFGHQASWNQ
jgi:hypothetical protein